jgi:DNA-binding GntR family transcriptional regulator
MGKQRDDVVTRLRELVVTGTFPPGEIFSENQLAEQFEVSRTPVREAVALLVRDRLLDQIPQVGITVHEMSDEELRDLLQTRELIETHVTARLALKPPLDEDCDALGVLLDKMRGAADVDDRAAFLAADATFHKEIAQRAGFSLAADLIAAMGDRIRLVGLRAVARDGGLRQVIDEHAAILGGIVAGDGQAAEKAMSKHLDCTMRRIVGMPVGTEDRHAVLTEDRR